MDYSDFPPLSDTQAIRIFVATWNVGGKPPHKGLNLNDLLPSDDQSDVYVLGFQEIVPLNAGNVLVIEDNEPAAKWLGLINQALNKSSSAHDHNISKFFLKPSLKSVRRSLRTVNNRQLKSCNCTSSEAERKYNKDSCFGCQQATLGSHSVEYSSEDDIAVESNSTFIVSDINIHQRFCLVACKQMVGIFVTVWVRRDMAQHVSHLRISCVSRGIMGYLGNKGCISVSMSLYQTRFCFVCSHLASGEKEGDELRRNSDVIETLKNTQFPRICRASSFRRVPDKILGHDRIIWLGDLNYRIALGYSETKKLLLDNNWDALLEKDQGYTYIYICLKMERETGRVFKGWKEGKIYFAPTYKYSDNSDAYAGEFTTAKKKRRTPAWCDRILWHGDGIVQLSYFRDGLKEKPDKKEKAQRFYN
ncbi:putative endonuclease/exonuclease/phosphatase [Dioscorea sansibarensis]